MLQKYTPYISIPRFSIPIDYIPPRGADFFSFAVAKVDSSFYFQLECEDHIVQLSRAPAPPPTGRRMADFSPEWYKIVYSTLLQGDVEVRDESRDTELKLFIWAYLYSVANERVHIWRGLREEMDQLTRPFFAAHLPSVYADSPGLLNFVSTKALTAASALVSAFTIMMSTDEHEPPPSSSNSTSALDSASFSHAGDLDDDAKLSVLYRRRNHIEVSDSCCVIISVDGALTTGKVITSVAGGTKKDVDVAVEAAKETYKKSWGLRCPGAQRGRYLSKLADLVEMSALETLKVGMPFMVAKNNDLTSMIAVLRYYAGWADKIHGKVTEGQIVSSNFPMVIPIAHGEFRTSLSDNVDELEGQLDCIVDDHGPLKLSLQRISIRRANFENIRFSGVSTTVTVPCFTVKISPRIRGPRNPSSALQQRLHMGSSTSAQLSQNRS
ncbi:uncharacterized protein ARMOST_12823 [Armillaria ostoyae]|uniref:Aldehyde dehydrogenase domain-containing protein n=1 Tax=Armillaria ostoyae TaxID=47428 RepID=A0A284RL57_ARMOS|nr:uncharacterized protein ARMOST_12823 [Armillaria ostoyae]